MKRHTAPLPAVVSLSQLAAEAAARFPTLVGFNVVFEDGVPHAAVYLPDGNTTSPAAWQASVAAHVPTRPTPEEAEEGRTRNADTLRDRAANALAGNRAFLAGPTTNATLAAQVKALTQQNNGIIRLILGDLDGTD